MPLLEEQQGAHDALASCFKPSTLIELLQYRAASHGDRYAYTFLNDGYKEGPRLTFSEVHEKAKAIGAYLQFLGLQGERALLIYPAGLDFIGAFFGCLYAGVIAVPFPAANPSQPARSLPKLQAIVNDAQPSIVLTISRLSERLQEVYSSVEKLQGVIWLPTDQMKGNEGQVWRDPAIHADKLAYLQYTSGSTARPKGVMVAHSNVLYSLMDMDQTWSMDDHSVMVSWLPHYHDLGLVYGILEPLYKGRSCYLMAPVAFVQRPIRWLEAISRYKATHSAAPNFAYEMCINRVTAEQLATLDLSSWRVTVDGAEPVRSRTIDRFISIFEPCGFRAGTFCPSYGLAEATLKVCTASDHQFPNYLEVSSDDLKQHRIVSSMGQGKGTQIFVSCGRPVLETEIVIANPESLQILKENEVGEIWVGGPLVAGGYWNQPAETQKTFKAFTADGARGPFLRTGDLGFIRNGELFITGRIKDLIIIAGRNHYPQDIELTAQGSHEAIRPEGCAAFSVDVDGEERLVIVAEIDRRYKSAAPGDSLAGQNGSGHGPAACDEQATSQAESIVRGIRRNVSYYHDIDVHQVILLKPGGVLKTSSGKIQRHACRDSFLEDRLALWQRV